MRPTRVTVFVGYAVLIVAGVASAIAISSTSNWALTVEQEAKLLPPDGEPGDSFGYAVTVERDTAFVGAWRDDDNGSQSGSAYVYGRTGGVWTAPVKLLPADGSQNDSFGYSFAVDGDTVIIGAQLDDDSAYHAGSAYVFTRTGGVWTEQAKLVAPDGAEDDHFGGKVALDGDMVVVGATGDDDHGDRSGSAYVFTRTDVVWTEQAKLLPSDGGSLDRFGRYVALSGDRLLIGAYGDDENGPFSGSAYLFDRSGDTWLERAKLVPADGAADDFFGLSVALDNDTAIIGAYGDDDQGTDSGSSYVFRLCDHRMTVTTNAGDTLLSLTPDPGLFQVASGNLSDLLADNDFSGAVCLVPFSSIPAVDPLPDPGVGDGRYYLARPLRYCQEEGFGESSLIPDPRDDLSTSGPCP